MGDFTDTVILDQELAYADVLPIAFRVLKEPLDAEVRANMAERNFRVLQACAAMEESGNAEAGDDDPSRAAELARIDLKINLLLDMVGHLLVASQRRPPPNPVRFNTVAAMWRVRPPLPMVGAMGLLDVYLKDWLSEPLQLLGVIAEAEADGRVRMRLELQSEALTDQIERMVFRRHRRQIAGARTQRRG
jgi:hypothetical protein